MADRAGGAAGQHRNGPEGGPVRITDNGTAETEGGKVVQAGKRRESLRFPAIDAGGIDARLRGDVRHNAAIDGTGAGIEGERHIVLDAVACELRRTSPRR